MKSAMMIAVCLLLLAGVAFAQGDGANNAPAPAPAPAPAAATTAPPAPAPTAKATGAAKAAVGGTRGYLKTSTEVEALWKELGTALSDLHQKQWEFYVLLNAETVDKVAVRTKYGECRDLNVKIQGLREKLKPSWVALDPKTIIGGKPAANKDGHRKQGGKKQGGKKNEQPAATPAAPAAAPAPAAPAGGQ